MHTPPKKQIKCILNLMVNLGSVILTTYIPALSLKQWHFPLTPFSYFKNKYDRFSLSWVRIWIWAFHWQRNILCCLSFCIPYPFGWHGKVDPQVLTPFSFWLCIWNETASRIAMFVEPGGPTKVEGSLRSLWQRQSWRLPDESRGNSSRREDLPLLRAWR